MIRNEESKHLIQTNVGSVDGQSIRSFASSCSTLNQSPISEKNFDLDILEHDSEFHTQIFSSQPQTESWRKTPLVPSALFLLLLRSFRVLLPSYLQPRDSSKPRAGPRKIHPTSYLDGLRGVAALIVFNSHFVLNWWYGLRNGYLNSEVDHNILQLPIVRLFFGGRASVAIFFVISGFVLSYKPLQLIRNGEKGRMVEVLGSSVLRRGVRLWVPIFFGTAISMLLAWKGCYLDVPSRGELIPAALPTLYEQVVDWWGTLSSFWLPWKEKGADGNHPDGFTYNGHLWTIPVEFYGSMVVFISVLGLSGLKSGVRMCVITALAVWALREGRWDVSLFLGGVVVAEWSLMIAEEKDGLPLHQASYQSSPEFGPHTKANEIPALLRVATKAAVVTYRIFTHMLKSIRRFKGPLNLCLLFLALFLLSYAGESPSPGYYHTFLIPWTPESWQYLWLGREHFWLTIGALILVFSLSNSTSLQKPFTTRFAQYLGEISYSLYIVHGMVLFTVGTNLQERWTGQVGHLEWQDNGMGELVEVVVSAVLEPGAYVNAFWMCAVINTVTVLWAADLFWRAVDGRVVGWGKLVEQLVSDRRR